jgi:hypothetical protein
LGIKAILERYSVCKMNNMVHFLLRNDETREMRLRHIKKEETRKKLDTTEERKYFFNWSVARNGPVLDGSYSLISEVYQMATYLQIGNDYNDKMNEVSIWSSEKESERSCKGGHVTGTINTMLERRHFYC